MFDKRVKYYHHDFSPEYFKNKGIRGYFILVLNEFVAFFQDWLEYRTMMLIAKEQKLEKEKVEALKRGWKERTISKRAVFAALNGPDEIKSFQKKAKDAWHEENMKKTLTKAFSSRTMRSYSDSRDDFSSAHEDFEPVGKSADINNPSVGDKQNGSSN